MYIALSDNLSVPKINLPHSPTRHTMPELPEVETTRRGIAPHLETHRIRAITVLVPKLRQPLNAADLNRISGHAITRVERRGKHLILHSDRLDLALHIHLGMSGALRIVPADSPQKKHDHVLITLDNGHELRLHDPRRFGHVALIDPTRPPASLANLGDEPLDDTFNGARLYAQTRGKTSAIKTHIMNQRYLTGVGNIYATEALFASAIHPARAAATLTRADCDRLADAIKAVLQAAIAQGGTTLRDFTQPDGTHGYFAQTLNAYGRSGEPCPRCGRLLHNMTLGGRSTVYCPHCQH